MPTGISYLDEVWNPVTGCSPISEGCANCWAKTMATRLKGMGIAKYQHDDPFAVRFHPAELEKPYHWRKPRVIGTSFMGDLFHKDVPAQWRRKIFDVMWQCPQHTFLVLTKRVERLVDRIHREASRCSFGWTQASCPPIDYGEYLSGEDVYMRNQCGWVDTQDRHDDNGCLHPHNDEGVCDVRTCPICDPAGSRAEIEEIGLDPDCYTFSDGYADDCDWMRAISRPRNGAVSNMWLGYSAWDQESLEFGAREFRQLRHGRPWIKLFVSIEPLLAPVDFNMTYYAPPFDPEDPVYEWSPLKRYKFSVTAGSPKTEVPYLNAVIVGCESGPKRRPCKIEWMQDIVAQCKAAEVPCYVKQVSIKGKVSHNPEEWPDDLREARELAWRIEP